MSESLRVPWPEPRSVREFPHPETGRLILAMWQQTARATWPRAPRSSKDLNYYSFDWQQPLYGMFVNLTRYAIADGLTEAQVLSRIRAAWPDRDVRDYGWAWVELDCAQPSVAS